jgi:hypothetical protein
MRTTYCKRLAGWWWVLAIPGVTGCTPAGQMSLFQPQVAGRQHEIRVQTDQVHWASASGVERVLAEFPLPGARTGRPTYLLYLRLPAGDAAVPFDSAASRSGQGFFIQTRGEYAGLARITGGQVRVAGRSQSSGATRTIDIDLRGEDGCRYVGQLKAVRDDFFVSKFETKQRPADVQALIRSAPKPPASQPAPTRPAR